MRSSLDYLHVWCPTTVAGFSGVSCGAWATWGSHRYRFQEEEEEYEEPTDEQEMADAVPWRG